LANNVVEELVEATEEIIANLTNKHAQQIKALVKSNKEVLSKLTPAILAAALAAAPAGNANPSVTTAAVQAKKHCKWVKNCKNAKICKHCNKKHPNYTKDKCWVLKANASTCPAVWTSSKSS
jgi:hypothetical protein